MTRSLGSKEAPFARAASELALRVVVDDMENTVTCAPAF